ncbi:hypothetical protein V3C99_016849 [Haemonchus contortus]
MALRLLVFLVLLSLTAASLRYKRHSPSPSLQHYFRDKALSQQARWVRQAYYGPQYQYNQYYRSPTYYNQQSSYYTSYRQPSQYYSQYPYYQQYQTQPYQYQYTSNQNYQQYQYNQYNQRAGYNGYGYSQYNYPSSSYGYSQPSSSGLQMDRFGNQYMMMGSFRLNVTCKSRGCPGKK